MASTTAPPSDIKLSICITTLNRGAFIGETLESILTQTTSECEVVILDAASTDNTEHVATEYAHRFSSLRYIRQEANHGLDRDYDRVVELARGEYCWLMTDDDLLKPGAVASVLAALQRNFSLIIANVESRNFDMSQSADLRRPWLNFDADRVYGPDELDRLFVEVGPVLRYIGCFIVKRSIWRARDRQRHYGSLFNYLGVVFQEALPAQALVIAQPLISYRWGNSHVWISDLFETAIVNLPTVVWSLGISPSAKGRLCKAQPWKSFQDLLYYRARGLYSMAEYRRLIRPRLHSVHEMLAPALAALLPGALVNALFVFYYSTTRRLYQGVWEPEVVLQAMKQSPFHLRKLRVFKRAW